MIKQSPEPKSFSQKINMVCPKCGRQITWFNDLPLKGFCWGSAEKEHKEYKKLVK